MNIMKVTDIAPKTCFSLSIFSLQTARTKKPAISGTTTINMTSRNIGQKYTGNIAPANSFVRAGVIIGHRSVDMAVSETE